MPQPGQSMTIRTYLLSSKQAPLVTMRSQTMQRMSTRASAPRLAVRAPARLQSLTRRGLTPVRVTEVSQDNFQTEVVQSDLPVVVDFWANWCGPCKLVAPLMDWAEKEYKGTVKVVKVEHDANPKLIEEFKVYGLPALVLIKDGKLVAGSKREGAVTKALFVDWLSKNGIPAPAKTH